MSAQFSSSSARAIVRSAAPLVGEVSCAANSAFYHDALRPCVLEKTERSQTRTLILPDEVAASGAHVIPSKPVGSDSRNQRIAAGGPDRSRGR